MVSARLEQIYDSVAKERGVFDCHQIIYAFSKRTVERTVCESPETRIKVRQGREDARLGQA